MTNEDTTVRRVSLSLSLSGALAALRIDALRQCQWPDYAERDAVVGIWETTEAIDVWRPGRDLVPDALATDEHWSLDPVPVRLLDVLPPDVVHELSGQAHDAARHAREDAYDEEETPDEELWLREVEAVRVTLEDWLLDWVAKERPRIRTWLESSS